MKIFYTFLFLSLAVFCVSCSKPELDYQQTITVTSSAKLDFLSDVPEFYDLNLSMTEAQLQEIIAKNNLKVNVYSETDPKSYHIFNQNGENVIVGFQDGKCTGIQRMRKAPTLSIENSNAKEQKQF